MKGQQTRKTKSCTQLHEGLTWILFCSFQVVMPCLTNTTVFSCAISWSISDSGPGLVMSDAPVLYRLLGASSKTPLLLPAFSSRMLTLDCALHVRAFLHRLGAARAEVKAPWEGLNGSATPASSRTY